MSGCLRIAGAGVHGNPRDGRALFADFVYIENGRKVVEDAKGVRTQLYQWKRRHFEIQYGMPITEV